MFKKKNNINNELYGIIGLGRFGFALAQNLVKAGKEVIVLDKNADIIKEASTFTENAFIVPNLTQQTLEEVGIQNCDTVVVCIGDKIDVSVLTTMHLINMGIPNVISKANSADQGKVLEKLGAKVGANTARDLPSCRRSTIPMCLSSSVPRPPRCSDFRSLRFRSCMPCPAATTVTFRTPRAFI